eukprot:1146385-Rhodomonas_salina.1
MSASLCVSVRVRIPPHVHFHVQAPTCALRSAFATALGCRVLTRLYRVGREARSGGETREGETHCC